MIKITPYYELPEKGRNDILNLYLEMVADVVPFLRCDVLDKPANSAKGNERARNRTQKYLNILKDYSISGGLSAKEQDAMLARKLIGKYSSALHGYLYDGIPADSCHVNRAHLRRLLTLRMPHGELPEDISHFCGDSANKDLLLSHVFRYDAFSSKQGVFNLLEKLGAEVCPYCNRQFITTVANGKHRTRPQLDHFKNKTNYPFLALSINNLVPCCGVCNLQKHDEDNDILYPYEDEMGSIYRFSTSNPDGIITSLSTGAECAPSDFEVELLPGKSNTPSELAAKAKASIDQFALVELYQSHKEYITELYFQRYIHTDEYMEEIINQFSMLFSQGTEAADHENKNAGEVAAAKELFKRKLALMDYRQEAWGKRPLSKLTHDIMNEIDVRLKKTGL